MKITFDTESYDPARVSKPYIALVDFTDPRGIPTWGNWIGQSGEKGVLEIEAQPGEVILIGQNEGHGLNPATYSIVSPDGELQPTLKVEAYMRWRATRALPSMSPLSSYSLAELMSEIDRRKET